MSCNYIVTAYRPTAVNAAVTGNFTGPNDLNLIQAKGNCLVVNQVTPEGLKPVVDVNIYGRITIMQLFRPKGEAKDLLFFMTARYHLAVLSFDNSTGDLTTRAYGDVKVSSSTGDLTTRAYGDVKDRVGRPTEGRQIGLVDPDCKVIALHLYAGLLKVVPLELDSGQELKAFNIRLEDLYAIDIQFLHGSDIPTIAYLAEEPTGRFLKTATISVRDKELVKGPWKPTTVDPQASLIQSLPLPYGGVMVVGYETISYFSREVQHAIDPPTIRDSIISCVGRVDGSRFLLGDANGRLLMLFVEAEERMDAEEASITGMRLEVLGESAAPSCLAYLDNGVVFVGSVLGDSQLVKLSATADDSGSFVQVMESFTSIGPIIDMCVVDLDKQGQDLVVLEAFSGQKAFMSSDRDDSQLIVSCSGHGRDGSLRVIRSGIGINEAASIDLQGIKGIWSLRCGPGSDTLDNTLVVSFVGQTTVLSLHGEEVEETDISGLASDQQTFFCGNVSSRKILQITSQSVRLINDETLELICKWHPPSGKNISTASCNSVQAVVAVGSELHYLEIKQNQIDEISHVVMEYEVACVDITPLGEGREKAELCAVGLWTEISVRMLQLPGLTPAVTQLLGGDIIPRSILMTSFSGTSYLLCALGDGHLLYYQLDSDSGHLSAGKRVLLGTKPLVLKTFKSGGMTNVFACSNHPTIIHCSNQKLLFSNVNLKEVNYLCPLNSEAFKESLALVDDNALTIGSVDQIQMLHIQTIPLGESPRRIAHQESSHTFAVLTMRVELPNRPPGSAAPTASASTMVTNTTVSPTPQGTLDVPSGSPDELEVFSVLLLEENTFEVLHAYQLSPREYAVSITSCCLGADKSSYYVVGTAFVRPSDKEPMRGRILVFQTLDSKVLTLVHEVMENGSVYQVVPFNNKLIASVNSKVSVYEWLEERELKEECTFTNNILSLFVKTKGDFILVGDLMRSFKLLVYKQEQGVEEIAMDTTLNPIYLSAIEMIDDENYIGADGRHVFICQKNSEASTEADLAFMLQPSRINIGDNINVFGRGSLVMEHPGSAPSPIQGKPLLYGTVHGAIGLIGQLNPDAFLLLMKLQNKMASVVKTVGNIEHEVYRSFATEHRTKMPEGFIDGDLVERFLDLPQAQMEEICKGIKTMDAQGSEVDVPVEDVIKLIEDLSRLH